MRGCLAARLDKEQTGTGQSRNAKHRIVRQRDDLQIFAACMQKRLILSAFGSNWCLVLCVFFFFVSSLLRPQDKIDKERKRQEEDNKRQQQEKDV